MKINMNVKFDDYEINVIQDGIEFQLECINDDLLENLYNKGNYDEYLVHFNTYLKLAKHFNIVLDEEDTVIPEFQGKDNE